MRKGEVGLKLLYLLFGVCCTRNLSQSLEIACLMPEMMCEIKKQSNVLRLVNNATMKQVLNVVMHDSGIGYSTSVIESRRNSCREFLCESFETASSDGIANLTIGRRPLLVICDIRIVQTVSKFVLHQPGNSRFIIVGIDAGSGHWTGKCGIRARTELLDGICIVGTGMPEFFVDKLSASESADNLIRYSRLIGAIGRVAGRLRTSRVMVIGAGRNGSAILQHFALLGVGALTIVDRDVLLTQNLDATQGVVPQQVGLPKARAVAESLCRLREDLSVAYLVKSASHRDVLEAARSADLIVSCVDNDAPRLAAAKIARQLLRPHLDIGTGITQQPDGTRMIAGDARLLMPGDGCVCCVGGLRNRSDAEFELRSPPNALRRGKPVAWNQERMGSLITINSMAVSTGVQLWLDLLSGSLPGSTWHRIRWVEGKGLESQASPVGASIVCDLCNRW